MQKHSNWKARRATDTRPLRPRQVAKAMLPRFQEMAGMTFLKRPLISSHARQMPCFAVGHCAYDRRPNS
jgi:hypothetical protein